VVKKGQASKTYKQRKGLKSLGNHFFFFCFHAENSAIHNTFAKKIRKVLPPHFSGAPIAPAPMPLA